MAKTVRGDFNHMIRDFREVPQEAWLSGEVTAEEWKSLRLFFAMRRYLIEWQTDRGVDAEAARERVDAKVRMALKAISASPDCSPEEVWARMEKH